MTSVPGVVRAPTRRSALFMGVIGSLALIAAIANSAASVGFPFGEVGARIVNALVTVDLIVAVVILLVAAVLTSRAAARPFDPTAVVLDRAGIVRDAPAGPGVLTVVGCALLAVDWVLWLAFSFPALLHGALTGDATYVFATTLTAVFGPIWVLGTVLSVIGFRRGGGIRNRRVALIGGALAVVKMAVVVLTALLVAVGALR